MRRRDAETILGWKFPAEIQEQARILLDKNREGTITLPEMDLFNSYGRVGMFLDILHVEARRTLRDSATTE